MFCILFRYLYAATESPAPLRPSWVQHRCSYSRDVLHWLSTRKNQEGSGQSHGSRGSGQGQAPVAVPPWGSCHQHVATFTQPRTSRRVPPGTQIIQDNLSKCQQTGGNVQILPCSVRGLLIARWGAAHRELHTRFPLTTTCKEFQYSQRCKKHAVPLKNRYKRWKKPSVSTKSMSAQLTDPTR